MRAHSHINSAIEALSGYDGAVPFVPYLKAWFRERSKYGSSDRRAITALCHGWLRLGGAAPGPPAAGEMLAGTYLTAGPLPDVLALKPEWDGLPREPEALGIDADKIFPFAHRLSEQVPAGPFSRSHLRQPDLFLRLRPGGEGAVEAALEGGGISFSREREGKVLRLPNGTSMQGILDGGGLERDYVVQDLSSTETLDLLQGADLGDRFSAWDCCAASGGKSILLRDTFPHCALTVSDIRKTILHNLADRFRSAGLRNYKAFLLDLSVKGGIPEDFGPFDLLLCDAPCSGSGTWGRSPEWLHTFSEDRIAHYARLQRGILSNAVNRLHSGGYVLYITCSVFREENEDAVAFAEKELGVTCLAQRYHAGWERGSDTLFSALLLAGRGGA